MYPPSASSTIQFPAFAISTAEANGFLQFPAKPESIHVAVPLTCMNLPNVLWHRTSGYFVPDERLDFVDDRPELCVGLYLHVDVVLDHRRHEVGQNCNPHVVANDLLKVALNVLQHLLPLADRTFRQRVSVTHGGWLTSPSACLVLATVFGFRHVQLLPCSESSALFDRSANRLAQEIVNITRDPLVRRAQANLVDLRRLQFCLRQ